MVMYVSCSNMKDNETADDRIQKFFILLNQGVIWNGFHLLIWCAKRKERIGISKDVLLHKAIVCLLFDITFTCC